MAASFLPPSPDLPVPIFKVSQKVERYLLYDIDTVTWLRKNHNILGVLIGTLPQIPQQSVFLGLPLYLQPEEARLLVEKGIAYTVNDLEWHTQDLRSQTAAQREAITAELHREGVEIAKGVEKKKWTRTQQALQKRQGKAGSISQECSIVDPARKSEDVTPEEYIFTPSQIDNPLPEPTQSFSKAWTLTPTTSHHTLTSSTRNYDSPLPCVSPSSYALFAHLHSLGYFMSPGIRFGCQFSVYPGDPLRFHSHFLAVSKEWDEEIDLLDLVGGGRLGTGVKKGWLIGGSERDEDKNYAAEGREKNTDSDCNGKDKVRTFCIEWGGM